VGVPLLVAYAWTSCRAYDCALSAPLLALARDGSRAIAGMLAAAPHPTLAGFGLFVAWYVIQAVLAMLLPGKTGIGVPTPAGHQLEYRLNGLLAWAVTHGLLYVAAFRWSLIRPTLAYDHGGGLLTAANAAGFVIPLFAFWKARRHPTHPDDRRFSGSALFDFMAGIELNPRVRGLDLKLFHVGHVGMMAWTPINLSLAAQQYQQLGHVTSSMLLLNGLQLVYVLDFFVREDWYLRTIDIHHEHFGWFLAWGSVVWVPFGYTLQALYLVDHGKELSAWALAAIVAVGGAGYTIFLTANRQRDRFRRARGPCIIWGREATFVPATFSTADGAVHETRLLTSGWWGMARHANYVGDLLMAVAFSLTCGVTHLLPYGYAIFLAILLVHRTYRDDRHCRVKYGRAWDAYCARVPYRLVPGVW
jgi:7-dehydrocholesterol reductase